MGLTDAELRHFHEEGYLAKPAVFSQTELRAIKDGLNEIIDREAQRLKSEGALADSYPESDFGRRLARIWESNPDAAVEIIRVLMGRGGGGYSGPAMFQMLTHKPLLSCIESLVGPIIIGSSVYRIRPKLPNWERGEVPWHQDSGYFLPHCDGSLIVTCWIPLVDATRQNGCLWVIPRRHRQGVIRHYTGGHGGFLEIPGDEFTDAAAIPIEIAAGGVLFLTNLSPHSSFENRTDTVRWSIDLRYQSAEVPNNLGEPPEAHTPDRDPVTMACYPPEADFVIRDPAHPEREVGTAAEFRHIRDRYEYARPHSPGRGWTRLDATREA